jgi:four helix bundle protein
MKNFLTYQVALEATRQMAGCLTVIKRKDRDLDKQLRRAMQSVVLNISEGNCRRGQDRLHLFRVAAGSAAEVQAGLDIAEAWGYLGTLEIAPVRARLDRVLGMLWRLTEGRRG